MADTWKGPIAFIDPMGRAHVADGEVTHRIRGEYVTTQALKYHDGSANRYVTIPPNTIVKRARIVDIKDPDERDFFRRMTLKKRTGLTHRPVLFFYNGKLRCAQLDRHLTPRIVRL